MKAQAIWWTLPLLSAAVWLSTLLGLLLSWITNGSPHYSSMRANQHIAYISDIAAEYLKPLFIAGCCITVVTLDVAIIADRWLRHRGYLVRNTSTSEKVLAGFSIFFALVGAAGLILLANFDTLRHHKLHDVFLLVFIAGYIFSAVFSCAEYQRLGRHQRQHRILRISFWIKLGFIIVELLLAIAFAVATFKDDTQAGAVIEWIIALIFTFWVLSFAIDLRPAGKEPRSSKGSRLEANDQ